MMSFALGINNGWLSATHHYFTSDHSPLGILSLEYTSWLGSIPFLSALLGLLVWGNLSERFGRKPAAFMLGLPFTVMFGMICLSHDQTVVLVARFIGGFANVGCIMCVTLYVKEIASSDMREKLTSMFTLSFSIGSVFVIAMSAFVSYERLHWILLSLCLLYLLLLCFIPESPVYHIKNNDFEKAKKCLEWLRQTSDDIVLNNEIETLKQLFINKSSIKFLDIFRNRYYFKSMLIGFFLQTCILNATGFSIFITFSSYIFEILLEEKNVSIYNVVFTLVQLSGCVLSFFIANRMGRRRSIVISCIILAYILFTISIYRYTNVHVFRLFPYVLSNVYVGLFSCITFPVIYIYFNEIIASESSNHIFTIMMMGKNLGWFCSVKLYTYLLENIHIEGAFMVFGTTCMLVAIASMFFPESKNKSLQTIRAELNC